MKQLSFVACTVLGAFNTHAVTRVTDVMHSETMDKDINYRIVLPASYDSDPERTFPVLYALHGSGSSEEPWSVMLPLNNAIDGDFPAIIVTFDGENSWYMDVPGNPDNQYTTFFFEELVPFVESNYRAGGKPSLRGVTGFSMGGFGAFHYMLEKPDFFGSVSGLSAAFDYSPFGQSAANPYTRIGAMAEAEIALPPIYLDCGSEDFLLEDNRDMHAFLTEKGYAIDYVETPGGDHNWTFWRDASDELIEWHYQHFSEAETWKGLPVDENLAVEVPGGLGWINVTFNPWVWSFKLSKWIYLSESWTPEAGGWIMLHN
jgi:S-formylglutathione hydrolase